MQMIELRTIVMDLESTNWLIWFKTVGLTNLYSEKFFLDFESILIEESRRV